MNLLAVDQSLSNTGWSIFDIDKAKVIEFSTIKTTNKENTEDRIFIIVNQIEDIIKKYNISLVCLEECLNIRNANVSKMLAGLRYSITYMLDRYKMLYHVIPPTAHKGREKKDTTIRRVKNLYNIRDIIDNNIADSISLGNYFINNISVEIIKRA